jgi:sulfoxide reductase heme-binding subunit YedZ
MNADQRLRRVYKPALFLICLLPLLRLIAGALQTYGIPTGISLGADPIAEILHSCGKWTLNFLLITLCVSPLRQITGWNSVIRLRRMLGLFAFAYAALHFTAYIVLDRSLLWSTIFEDILKRPYITIGVLALLMLIPLAVTSTNRMMRKLGKRWQKLHRLVYPIAILGVWHYYWQVKADVREPLIYAGILAVLLGWRVWRWRRRQASNRSPDRPQLREGA